MINKCDVIRVKMPFPNINAGLAVVSHMYICYDVTGVEYRFIKCQTLKPAMLSSTIMRHYWDEQPNINRNPFSHLTRIDCDKIFATKAVTYDDSMKTTTRPDVSQDLMQDIEGELRCDGYVTNVMNDDDVVNLNPLTQKVV